DVMWESPFGPTMPAYYAMHARAHMDRYGTTEEQLALVSVKNHVRCEESLRNVPKRDHSQ
ncbi:MAG TPA: hypothetical protein VEC43_00095, partial [Candidatus Acidoferrales bacterium]|nr:hypothetical protein [Candidatus Acidoferrales bacterium]